MTDGLDELHFLSPGIVEAEIAAKAKTHQKLKKPRDWNEAISYCFTSIISPISHIVTGCARHRLAALCQGNNSM